MKRHLGFSLIELLIVIAVIGILTAFAYPAYLEQVQKSRRSDAMASLTAFAVAMERYYTEQTPATYLNATAAASGAGPGSPINTVFPSEAPLDGATKYYDLAISTASQSAYTLSATPKNTQIRDKCGTLILSSTGFKGATGAAWQECWQ